MVIWSFYNEQNDLVFCLQEPNQNSNCLKISLHNHGYGFGFTIQEAEDKSIVVSTIVHEGVAHKVTRRYYATVVMMYQWICADSRMVVWGQVTS